MPDAAVEMHHFLSLADHSTDAINHVLDVAFALREGRPQGNEPVLRGKTLCLIFEKPSLRTRVSFEQAMIELGGHAITLQGNEIGLGQREPAGDVARVVSGMVQGICARVFEHEKLIEMRDGSAVPVVNALSDRSHPCQALADAMTLIDAFGRDLAGKTVAFIGDGNNVAYSTALLCGRLHMQCIIASPEGYELPDSEVQRIRAAIPDVQLEQTADLRAAVRDADVLYTDTWTSMGQEKEKQQRVATFKGYQVNAELLALAPKHAIVLHCLPAYRGNEITAEVIDSTRSWVFTQAHNRLHAQKGLLAVLLGDM